MKEKGQTLRRITGDELQGVLEQVRVENGTELAVIGPNFWLGTSLENWPGNLKTFPVVFQLIEDIDDIGKRLVPLTSLTRLLMWGIELGDVGAQHLAGLTNLTTLDLSYNQLGDASAQHLAGLTNLTTLDLDDNQLGDPGAQSLARLIKLINLNLSTNEIRDDGVRHLAGLKNLANLDLSYNQIGDRGAQHLAGLTNLTNLDLSYNQIGDRGAQHLAGLTNLTNLDLNSNQLDDAGAQYLAGLTNLTNLDLSSNEIGDAGARHLAGLTKLANLNLWNNQLGEAGAQHLAGLINLTNLDLSSNEIGEAGVQHLAGLTNLTTLDLSYTQLGDAGARHLVGLTNLTTLNLSHIRLGDAGARHLAGLTNLTTLDLNDNQLGEAGAKHLAELTNLANLDLSYNQLGDAGVQHLAGLTNLTNLNLWNNQLGDAGARHLAGLTNLTKLNLGSNQFGEAGTQHLARLAKLTNLDLSTNEIGDDGVRHLASLTNLITLSLRNIRLGDAGIRHLVGLTNLTTLDLNYTEVADLSSLRGLFEKGVPPDLSGYSRKGVLVKGCPLTQPPAEIVERGLEAVLNYYQEIDSQGTEQLYEAKMLIVGEGRAGKTSLLRRLYQPELELPTEDDTTKGIEICRRDFELKIGRPFRLNIWDFAGQEIYHATHQFFLTKNSLYILLDDTAKDHKSVTDEVFRYWLEVIELLSDGSPVLIFQNEKGGRSKPIDEAGLKGRFPNVKDVYRGNLFKKESITGLSEAIKYHVQQLPHIGEELPAKWVSIRAAIEEEARQKPYISQQDYFKIYAEHLELDQTKALHLSRYLHDLGVFLHFQDNLLLNRIVILQNGWATEAVFRVLDDEIVKAQLGRFTLQDCQRLWTGSAYADKHPELLALMEKFELCYPLTHIEHTWLAPQLLPPSRPEALNDWEAAGDLVLSYRYVFMPRGLVSRLMVRMHRFVRCPDLAWTDGVLFEREETQVLVQATPRGNEIVLRARGPEHKGLLSVIASDLDALNASFKGLDEKLQKFVPCVCDSCKASSTPELFEQKRLLKRKRDNKLSVECPASYDDVSVLELLDGLKLDQLPSWSKEKPAGTEREIKIFLASSSELVEDRDAFDLYFRQHNDHLRAQGIYLKIVRWENFLDAMSETRLQDEYNREVRDCDIFVSLFMTKTGKFTEEEFDTAHQAFKASGSPKIYTFFKDAVTSTAKVREEDFKSLWAFQKKLKELGHFHTGYESTEHLKRQFRDQLDKLLDQEIF